MLTALRDRDQLLQRRRRLRDPRVGRAAAAHADDDGVGAELAEQAGPVAGHRRLAGPLAGGDHGQLGPVELDPLVARRLEPRAGRLVGEPEAQRQRSQPQLAGRGYDRLVGEVDNRVGAGRQPRQRRLHVGLDRHAVVRLQRAGRELLLAAAEDDPGQVQPGQRVADHRWVVLTVDERDHGHGVHSCRTTWSGARAPTAACAARGSGSAPPARRSPRCR
jgi:hypothetical protein